MLEHLNKSTCRQNFYITCFISNAPLLSKKKIGWVLWKLYCLLFDRSCECRKSVKKILGSLHNLLSMCSATDLHPGLTVLKLQNPNIRHCFGF